MHDNRGIAEQYVERRIVHREKEREKGKEGKRSEEGGLEIIPRWNLSGIPEGAPLGAAPVKRIVLDLERRTQGIGKRS